jgi:hypothetical protein
MEVRVPHMLHELIRRIDESSSVTPRRWLDQVLFQSLLVSSNPSDHGLIRAVQPRIVRSHH